MSGTIQKHDIISPEALKVFADIVTAFQKLIAEANKLKGSLGGAGLDETSDSAKKAKENISKLEFELEELTKQMKKLGEERAKTTTAGSRQNKEIIKEQIARKKVTAAIKEEITGEKAAAKAKLAKKEADRKATAEMKTQDRALKLLIASQKAQKGTVDQLNKVNAVLRNRIKGLNTAIPEERKKVEKLTAAIERNNQKKKTLTKTNSGLWTSFKKLAKSMAVYALAYVGITKVISFFTNTLFNLTKKLSALDFTMKTIIADSNELAVTQSFLARTAANYGQSILTLTERYLKFRAAAQQSNMTANETMSIFNSVAKAAGVLGLKTDEVNGVFLALEQMISKGKVTTEELRRQLGERLPGAMGIMADAVGVSISELDKMLKAGEVLSTDALPKFAKALEIAYGIESVTKIDNLVAAQGRLSTSFTQFATEFSSSGPYQTAINGINNAFNRMKIHLSDLSGINVFANWLGGDMQYLETYQLMTTKAGDATRAFIEVADDLTLAQLKAEGKKGEFLDTMDREGLTMGHAKNIWEEYIVVREAAAKIDEDAFKFEGKFDLGGAIGMLDQAEEDIDSFSKLAKGGLRDAFVIDSNVLSKGITDYKDYLNNIKVAYTDSEMEEAISVSPRTATELAKERLDEIESTIKHQGTLADALAGVTDINEKKKIRQIHRNNATEARIRLENYQNRLALEIEINNRLQELEKKKKSGGKDNRLSLLKAQQALELAQLRLHHSKVELEFDGSAEELKQLQYDNDREIIVQQIEDTQEQKRIAGLTASELLGIEKSYQEKKRDMILLANDYLNGAYDVNNKERLKEEKDARDKRIDAIIDASNEEIVARSAAASKEFHESNRRQKDRIAVYAKASIDILEIKYNESLLIMQLYGEETEEYKRQLDIQAKYKQDLDKLGIDATKKLNDQKIADFQEAAQAINEAVQEGFNFGAALNERAVANNERRYELETEAAGTNKFKQLVAEKKYEKEAAKLKRKKAIADKAAAVTQIITNTAIAISAATTTGPLGLFLIPLLTAIGALQLATVIAQPIPQFAEGVENFGGGLAVVGDKKGDKSMTKSGGSELLLFPSGKSALSPSSPTLMDLPVGTSVVPHDETTRILANEAMSRSHDMIDMSPTNRHLKSIDRNTSESIDYSKGYKIVKRKGFTGRYRV